MSEKVGVTRVQIAGGLPRACAAVVLAAVVVLSGSRAVAQQEPQQGGQAGAAAAAPATTATTAPVKEGAGDATTREGATSQPVVEDGPAYPISAFDVRYKAENASLPPMSVITARPITLGVINNEYVVPPSLERKWVQLQGGAMKPGAAYKPREIEVRKVTLDQLNDETVDLFHTSAIWAVNEQIKSYLNERGVIGVYVAPDTADVDTSGADKRPPDKKSLALVVYTGVVREVRTVASGERVPEDARINNPMHARILADSPVKPESSSSQTTTDLLRRDLLDRYVYSLNRHPGRRVDVAVSAFGDEPGEVILDYLVTEAKPWAVYAQVSNTGTKDTNEWRERFGFVHNQLTNHDDILSIDYITAGFEDSTAVQGSYEAPLFGSRKFRWRVFGSYSQFTASDVGQARENFDGRQYDAGAEVIANVYQRRDFFVDVFAGGRYENVRVDNKDVDVVGQAGFAVPYVGARAQRLADAASTFAELTLSGRFTGASQADLDALGRFNADKTAVVLQFQFSQSIFLEPLLFPQAFKEARTTLAHEIVLSARAQTSFGARLIPQAEDVIGGLYSVRGYEESVAAGDDVLLGSIEYRWHVPRSLRPEPAGSPTRAGQQPFKWVPQQVYGRPDWDLILRTFLDVGQTYNADRLAFENDETLIGVGIGAEVQIKQNVSVRVDWGFPLHDLPGQSTDSSRVHVAANFMW